MIALDAMGGDTAPHSAVWGAIGAAQKGIPVILFGQEDKLLPILKEYEQWQSLPLRIVDCSQVVSMAPIAPRVLLREKDSSLMQAIQAVASGMASAVVSAGNSGAALVGGVLVLGKVDGIDRPAIGDFLPTDHGTVFCLDLGANTDCKPEYLEQFALMGHVYVQITKRIDNPSVGLLSNGVEPYKGPALVRKAYEILSKSGLRFIGNVESRDVFTTRADVLVCDGFAGNVLLKAIQGTVQAVTHWFKREASSSWFNRVVFALGGKKMFTHIKNKSDYAQKGGALLLGLKKPFIIAHGCSDARAIENAILFAHTIVKDRFLHIFNEKLSTTLMRYNMKITDKQFSRTAT